MNDLERDSHIPLAHQIATALQYRIATGQIRLGTLLPSYRAAAVEWGVNLHTVRRAYLELATWGLVRIDDRRGAVVLDRPVVRMTDPLDDFAREVLDAAAKRFSVTGSVLIAALERQVRGPNELPRVWALECSRTLARSLAEQVSAAWAVEARGCLIAPGGEVPAGALITTYFHFDELRQSLASRGEDLEVVHIRPSLALLDRLRTWLRGGTARRLVLLDSAATFAHAVGLELRHYLGSDLEIDVRHPKAALGSPRRRSGELCLVSPRDWDRVGPELRRQPNVHRLDYDIDVDDLTRIARRRGWTKAAAISGQPGQRIRPGDRKVANP